MKKIQKCTKSTCKNVQKTSKTSIIVPKPDIISLKTSQDISLVNVTSAFLARKMVFNFEIFNQIVLKAIWK